MGYLVAMPSEEFVQFVAGLFNRPLVSPQNPTIFGEKK
jgi:hypothetical protein